MNTRLAFRRVHSARRLRLEPLESRSLLDGDLLAALQGGDLVVRGDAEGNHVTVTQDAPGRYTLTGRDDTTINGQPAATFDVPGGMRFTLGDGYDDVVLEDVTLAGGLRVDLGNEPDALVFANVTLGGDLRVEMGRDSDIVGVEGALRVRDLSIDMGSGNLDTCGLGDLAARNASLVGGAGKDWFFLDHLLVERLFVDLGSGDDFVRTTDVAVERSFTLLGGVGRDEWWHVREVIDPAPGDPAWPGPWHDYTGPTPVVAGVEFDAWTEEVLQRLTFTLEVGQSASDSLDFERTFTTDYDAGFDANGRPIALPVTTTSTFGLSVTVGVLSMVVQDTEPRFVTVSVDLEQTYLDQVKTLSVPLPGGRRVIEQPVFSTLAFETSAEVPDGGTVLFGGEKVGANDFAPQKKSTEVNVTPRVLPIEGVPTQECPVEVEVRVIVLNTVRVPRPAGDALTDFFGPPSLEAPQLTLFDGETRTIERRTRQPMVTGIDLVRSGRGRTAVDPLVEAIETGVAITTTLSITDRRFVLLDIDLEHVTLAALGSQGVPTPYGLARAALPALARTHIDTHFAIPDGGTAVVGSFQDGQGITQVLATARIIINAGEEEATPGPLQATVEYRLVHVAGIAPPSDGELDSIRVATLDGLPGSIVYQRAGRYVTGVEVAALPGGGRRLHHVVSEVVTGGRLAITPVVSDDFTAIDAVFDYSRTEIARVNRLFAPTPFGTQSLRRPVLATLVSSGNVSLLDLEPLESDPLADSLGRAFRLRHQSTLSVFDNPETDPLLVISEIARVRGR